MATGGAPSNSESLEKRLSCSVCLDILENPVSIPCGHTFCSACLDQFESSNGSCECPICRSGYNPKKKTKAYSIEEEILQSNGLCQTCKRLFPMGLLRAHRASCFTNIPSKPFRPVAPTFQEMPRVKNRSTFTCPYCQQSNLDSDGMLKHVNNNHRRELMPVVCPICASMPWGNPNQKSGNFVQHLNLRHKFEYNTFVNFEEDEDATLRQVLALSMEDC